MKKFFTVFSLEARRIFGFRNTLIYLLFVVLSLYFVQTGIHRHKEQIDLKAQFKEIEQRKVGQYATFGQYGAYGIRLLFFASPLSAFFINSSVISEITAKVDSGEILYIYNSFKGRALFSEKLGGFKDFSGIVLLFGSLLVLYLGFEAFLYKDYVRLLSGFLGPLRLFASVILSRLFLLILFFVGIVLMSVFWFHLNGMEMAPSDFQLLLFYVLVAIVMLLCFFLLGCFSGIMKSRYLGFVLLILFWFVFVFLVPGVMRSIISNRADNITSTYRLELRKLQLLMDFEHEVRQKMGGYTKERGHSRAGREMMEKFWNNGFRQILDRERELALEMNRHIDFFTRISTLCPTMFYLSTANEVSSKGYQNFIAFYAYILELKKKFVRFYLDHRLYIQSSQIVPFITGEENIFYARGRLPPHFGTGLLVSFLYVLCLVVLAYRKFRRSLIK